MGIERAKDPHAPKPSKTPFNFFGLDARQKAKESFPELTSAEVTKRVCDLVSCCCVFYVSAEVL